MANNKGVVLILTVGILSLLTLVATSFALNMLMDFKSTKNFKNTTEAGYLAEAGINRAIAELLYGNQGFVNDAVDLSTEAWALDNPYSGAISNGGYTVTKIYDCAGQIYINNGTNPNLSAMLENLVGALIASGATSLAAGDGALIVTSRPASGYMTKEDIMNYAGFSRAKYDAIKDYITVYAFADPDVVSATSPYPAAPRAPVNVNTASRQVLIAVLTGITDSVNSISSIEADSLAGHLINNRPYATYGQLWSALLTAETLNYIADGDAAVVMANANPNTDLMRANPNYSWRYKHVSAQRYYNSLLDGKNTGVPVAIDKTMLTVHTAEFCFNSGGYYEINATGFVRDAAGSQVATKKMQAIVKLFDIWKQTTQAEFAQGTLSNVELYPEYDQASSGIPAAAYDGQIMLATLKSNTPDASSALPHFRMSLTHKDGNNSVPGDNLNADVAGGDNQRHTGGAVNPNPREAGIVGSPAGNLFPDGLFFPRDEPVTNYWFYPDNNIDAVHGAVEIWFKPNWDHMYATFPTYSAGKIFEAQNRIIGWATAEMDIYVCPTSDGSPGMEIHWRIHDKYYGTPPENPRTEWYIKYGLRAQDLGDHPWKAGIWHHIAVTWDFPGQQILYIDGQQVNTFNLIDPPNPFSGDNGLEFGCDTNYQEPPNGTLNEVRIFASPAGADPGGDQARGIYYDAADAFFESSSNPVGPARLGTISWTEHTTDIVGIPIVTGADVTFDVFDGSNWIGNSGSRSNPAGNPLNLPVTGSGSIKYRANLLETGDGLFDTPVLDDVTITYLKGVKILYRREV